MSQETEAMGKRKVIGFLGSSAIALLAGCLGDNDTSDGNETTPPPEPTETPPPEPTETPPPEPTETPTSEPTETPTPEPTPTPREASEDLPGELESGDSKWFYSPADRNANIINNNDNLDEEQEVDSRVHESVLVKDEDNPNEVDLYVYIDISDKDRNERGRSMTEILTWFGVIIDPAFPYPGDPTAGLERHNFREVRYVVFTGMHDERELKIPVERIWEYLQSGDQAAYVEDVEEIAEEIEDD